MDFSKKNDNIIYELYEKVIKPILGLDVFYPFLHFISRVIAGKYQDKLWSRLWKRCFIWFIILFFKTILMRTNYVNEIYIRRQGTLISFNKDMPKVELADVFQKLVPYSLPSNFFDEIYREDLKKNPHYKLSDPNIQKIVSKEEVCEALFGFLQNLINQQN